MDEGYIKLDMFVNCVADLAVSLEADIKNGKVISNDTVLCLSRLVAASAAVEDMLAPLKGYGDNGYEN